MHWRKKYEKKSFFLCCIAGVPILSRPPVSRWIALYSVSRKVWSKTHRGRLSDKKSEETKKRSVKFSTAWINVPRVVRREKFYRSKEEWYSVLWQKIVKLLHAVRRGSIWYKYLLRLEINSLINLCGLYFFLSGAANEINITVPRRYYFAETRSMTQSGEKEHWETRKWQS